MKKPGVGARAGEDEPEAVLLAAVSTFEFSEEGEQIAWTLEQ